MTPGHVTFRVPIRPTGLQRGRAFVDRRGVQRVRDTVQNKNLKAAIGLAAIAAKLREITGPVSVWITGHGDSEIEITVAPCLDPSAFVGRYDGDNLGKLVLDGLERIAYRNDRQVTFLAVAKRRD